MAHPNRDRLARDEVAEQLADAAPPPTRMPRPGSPTRDALAGRSGVDVVLALTSAESHFAGVVDSAPEPHRAWLRAVWDRFLDDLFGDIDYLLSGEEFAVYRDRVVNDDLRRRPSPAWVDVYVFLEAVREQGLVGAAVGNIDTDDPQVDVKARRRWGEGRLPNHLRSLLPDEGEWTTLLEKGLEPGREPWVRDLAAKWLPTYAPADRAVALLRGVLTEPGGEGEPTTAEYPRFWAAVHLSELAPETPDLAVVLVRALAATRESNSGWRGWHDRKWGEDTWPESGAWEAAEALHRLGPGAFAALTPDAAGGLVLALGHPAEPVRTWAATALGNLTAVPLRALEHLAAVRGAGDYPEAAAASFERLAAGFKQGTVTLRANSAEDALLLAVLLNPEEDTTRLVYADWLDEHDRPQAAAFVRLDTRLHHIPEADRDPAEAEQLDTLSYAAASEAPTPDWYTRWKQITRASRRSD